MDRIKEFFIVFCCSSILSAYSFAGDQNVIYCPKQITCNLGTCQLSDNQYQIWKALIPAPSEATKSVYKFSFAYFAEQYSYDKSGAWQSRKMPTCVYDAKKLIEVALDDRVSELVNITQVETNDPRWKIVRHNGFDFLACSSDDPQFCPLTEAPEINLKSSFFNHFNSMYFNWIGIESNGNLITYDQLIKKCGAVSECTLKIQARDTSGYHWAGSVVIDLTTPNAITVKNIETYPDIPCKFAKMNPLNVIVCYPKK